MVNKKHGQSPLSSIIFLLNASLYLLGLNKNRVDK